MIVFSVKLQHIEGIRGYWIQEPNDDIYIRGKIPEYSLKALLTMVTTMI